MTIAAFTSPCSMYSYRNEKYSFIQCSRTVKEKNKKSIATAFKHVFYAFFKEKVVKHTKQIIQNFFM